ncbi:MAG TPA: NADH-quinone oxidoreductase subunit M [Thermodesulfobacteriota bacterium]|nr:NADH-quinone oxidoreductase subunit M [Thermodesulfobacteriota bacterium]
MTSETLPILSLITLSPFIGAVILLLQPERWYLPIRLTALSFSIISFLGSIIAVLYYDSELGGFQFNEYIPIVHSLGIGYHLGADGISLVLILLTGFILVTGVFASWTIPFRSKEFYILLLLLVTGVFGVFVSLDLFLLFLFYELAVLPMYLLIGIWGSSTKIAAKGPFARAIMDMGLGSKEYGAMKLTLYLLFGSAFILVAILGLYSLSGLKTFDYIALEGVVLPSSIQNWLFLLLYVGFGSLAGIWPIHTWSPDGHAAAPTATSMMHAGVLMKLGAYGIIRIGMGLLPEAAQTLAPIIGTIAVINIVYGAFGAMWQRDLKYVVAYSSVSHMGIVMLGAATLNEMGLNGSVLQMFSHGIMTGLLFALVGLIYEKAHSREILQMGGFAKRMPGIATFFAIGALTSLGLPGLSGFVAELLVFLGAWKSPYFWWLIPAVFGAFITAVYALRVLKWIFFGTDKEPEINHKGNPNGLKDAIGVEWIAPIILSAVLIVVGIYPKPLLQLMDSSVIDFLERVLK